jgi:ferredoxin-NADP reductase
MPGDANGRYLLIGTGTGITPYRSMLPQLERLIADRGIEVVLMFGARNPAELLYGDEFRAFAARHPSHFRFVPCFSRELPGRGRPRTTPTSATATCSSSWPNSRPTLPATSPTSAATRTWSTPASSR